MSHLSSSQVTFAGDNRARIAESWNTCNWAQCFQGLAVRRRNAGTSDERLRLYRPKTPRRDSTLDSIRGSTRRDPTDQPTLPTGKSYRSNQILHPAGPTNFHLFSTLWLLKFFVKLKQHFKLYFEFYNFI